MNIVRFLKRKYKITIRMNYNKSCRVITTRHDFFSFRGSALKKKLYNTRKDIAKFLRPSSICAIICYAKFVAQLIFCGND